MESTIFDIAIIIPTLNEEIYIESCIDSIRSQSYPFERMDIMVIDGGSNDKTCQIVKKKALEYTNIRLIPNPKRLQSIAFNIGVANSAAPYIIRLDAHVKYDNRYIELCLKHLESEPQLGDVGGICITDVMGDGILPKANAILCQSRFGIGGAAFRVGATSGFVDTVPFGAFPRKIIDQIGGMREDLPRAEDNEYTSRIRKAGYKILLDPDIVSTYYVRGTFGGLIKQMYTNGISIGHLFYIDKAAIGIRHFVPFVFVMSLIVFFISGIFWRPARFIILSILVTYLACSVFASIIQCNKHGWECLFILPLLFFCVHVSYGGGTLIGLIKHFGTGKK